MASNQAESLYRCGIYVRVSTEEQAENPEGSIKNQEQRLREFVKLKQLVGSFGEVSAVEKFWKVGDLRLEA
jgi:DNA invertase Pin-like site-specific DNA recombinase